MSDCLEATSWAVTECADADLGDLRRTQRVVALAQRPGLADFFRHHAGARGA